MPTLEYWQNFFLKNEKIANRKLGNLGNIIPSFLISEFSIFSYSQNRKLGFKNLGKKFPRFPRFPSFRPSLVVIQKTFLMRIHSFRLNIFYYFFHAFIFLGTNIKATIFSFAPSVECNMWNIFRVYHILLLISRAFTPVK